MTVNFLLCDEFPGIFPSIVPAYVTLFTDAFAKAKLPVELKVFRAMEGELPQAPFPRDEIFLIPGCRAGAYDELPWIKNLLAWIRLAHEQRANLLGICFGHQAIAQALGGEVKASPKGWGVGLRESCVEDPEALSFFPQKKMALLYNHFDQVVRLPAGAQRLATSLFCENEGFRLDKNVVCFQGHPEYTKEFAQYFIETHGGNATRELRQKALESLNTQEATGISALQYAFHIFGKK